MSFYRDVSRENTENEDICLIRLFSHPRNLKLAGVTCAVSNKAINHLWNFVTGWMSRVKFGEVAVRPIFIFKPKKSCNFVILLFVRAQSENSVEMIYENL